jgi:hypothetical protein
MVSAAALLFVIGVEASASPATPDAAPTASAAVFALSAVQDPPPVPKPDVDVTVTTERTTWYADPVWITVGVIAAIVVIALIVAASRSGGTTTVVK